MSRIAIGLVAGLAGLLLASPAAHASTHDDIPTKVDNKNSGTPAWKIALDYAMDKRGTPYVWGGASKRGYDCSGLMLRAYRAAGIELPRTAAEQYNAFSRKISWKHIKPGDLVFFHGLGHVGMVTRPGYMVDAPHTGDVVKEEKLDAYRRQTFDGAVRPDPAGVRQWDQLHEVGESHASDNAEL